jgi:branched-chain amino acid transport system permease protein
MIFGLAVIGLNLLMGFAGQLSLGHAGFLGIGGYTVAIGSTFFGTPPWLCILAGAALSGLIAFFVGRPILRLKGHYARGGNTRIWGDSRHEHCRFCWPW